MSCTVLAQSSSASPTQVAQGKPTPAPRTAESAVIPVVKNPERHAEFLFRKTEGKIGLLFLGDSITDFWPSHGQWSWLKFAPYQPADFGVGADRTEHLLWRISNGELDGIDPKVTVILIGTNNVGQFRDEKPEWAAAGVKKIVEVVHEKMPQTKVLLLGVFPRAASPTDPLRGKVSEINAIISKLDDHSKTRYLDISKAFLDANGNLPKDVMPDSLHPNAHGYDLWYDAMHPLLDEMMK